MNPERPNQDELQRALALKGLKQPPQRFFDGLSEKVMDRLQHPEPPPEPTLLQRLGLDFETKTVVLCLSGLAVSGLLAFALISSRGMKAPPPTTPDPLGPQPIRAGAVALDSSVPMPSQPAKPSETIGGAEPVTVSPDSGRRIPPPPPPLPRPPQATPGNPANPGK